MKALATFAFCSLLIAANAAFADTNTRALSDAKKLNPPRVYSASHPAAGTKSSSFAPHPHNRNHTYGAPIQSPILKMQPKKPATPRSSTPATPKQ
jgi:hypothetical protein